MGKSGEWGNMETFDAGSAVTEAIDEIDELCVSLFDLWCEHRRVVPLAYLMHSWPIANRDYFFVKRLFNTLNDLVTFHGDSLTTYEHKLIHHLLEVALDATLH
jgi:hypothetical protein